MKFFLLSALRFILVIAFLSTTSLVTAKGTGRPNIIVILTDDQGWGDLSLNGNTNLQTPNIDSLAKDGASFDRFFACPVCSPTRAEFLTGRYHVRGGVYSTSAGGERLNLDESTIAQAFQGAGYATGAFGKWHNGMQYPYHPNGRGFDEYYGFCSGHWGDYFSPPLEHNGNLVKGSGFAVDDFTDKAMRFIEKNQENPFFAYLAYNTPHSPMQVPDDFWDRFENKELAMRHRDPSRENINHTRAALAMCENIDWNVGRLLQQLDSLKLEKDTIVVYFCDNGPNGSRWNGGMKGRKGSTDEGGVRSPLLIRWPGKISQGKQVKQIAAAIDLLPTLTDLAGFPAPRPKPLDGMSLKPLLLDPQPNWPGRLLFSQWRNKLSVRSQDFRLGNEGALFNLQSDPGQRTDVRSQHPEEFQRLSAAISRWKEEFPKNDQPVFRPFLIGNPDFIKTQIPARDGIGHGNIKRSNRFPNCSFFTNWSSTEDHISWDAEVLESGEYSVELHYTCGPDDTGAAIELEWMDQRLQATITEAHNPPIRGGENDRIKRTESYVKAFKPMPLGTIRLTKGRGRLNLRATKIPGEYAMDFRLLMFTRLK
ncbi:MAG: arylsulfatase [Verrucomicrobia bacterium]|nr:arylsulfatase [Verrucomicrobiota bacterium]